MFCDRIIEDEAADIVFLQEVIPETLEYIQDKLPAYHCIPGSQVPYAFYPLITSTSTNILRCPRLLNVLCTVR